MEQRRPITDWLPLSREEMQKRGWQQADIIIVTGDAYVDHPSFGHAVIARILERDGFRVAILPQPNWRDDLRDFKKLGAPRLFFGVTSGCMDSMVNHYTATKRLRSNDSYTAGDVAGFRPDYACTVYTKILKQLYPSIPVVLGGVEASLRRTTHYDYWSDSLMPSILSGSGADMLVYGMGEQPIREIASGLDSGMTVSQLDTIPQTAFLVQQNDGIFDKSVIELPSHDECYADKKSFANHFTILETASNSLRHKKLVQKVGNKLLVINPPCPQMDEENADSVHDLPYTRLPHPRYQKRGKIPAWDMIRFSINTHRGCFGGCSFCTISAHQGKFIVSRSEKSILKEIKEVAQMPGFGGTITDLGGPSANMYRIKGREIETCNKCVRPSCIFPRKCSNLHDDHQPMTVLYRKALKVDGVKNVFIGSGVRYDMLVGKSDADERRFHYAEYLKQLVMHHVSGRLKVAPEHTEDDVLKLMRKPGFELFYEFAEKFSSISNMAGKNQFLVPYFISGHPGCNDEHMRKLGVKTRKLGLRLEQVQDLTPTPMTLSSVMFYTGFDPYTMKPLKVVRSKAEKDHQKSFFFSLIKATEAHKKRGPKPRH